MGSKPGARARLADSIHCCCAPPPLYLHVPDLSAALVLQPRCQNLQPTPFDSEHTLTQSLCTVSQALHKGLSENFFHSQIGVQSCVNLGTALRSTTCRTRPPLLSAQECTTGNIYMCTLQHIHVYTVTNNTGRLQPGCMTNAL